MSSSKESKEPRIGLVQVITGNGKGKTTSALGTVIRALGHGFKVYVTFFMKSGQETGEYIFLSRQPGVKVVTSGTPEFIDPKNIKPEQISEARNAFATASKAVMSGAYDLVVLDELNLAAHWKLLALGDIIKLIRDKPPRVELILTGRQAPVELIQIADLVTECREIKHPYKKGIGARKGIEY